MGVVALGKLEKKSSWMCKVLLQGQMQSMGGAAQVGKGFFYQGSLLGFALGGHGFRFLPWHHHCR
jgi:hypothetical protein